MTNSAPADCSAPWWTGETAVRIADLPRILPRRPDGGKVSVASAFRYATAGVRGVRLRRFRSGGAWATTAEEVTRWQAALTRRAGGDA